MTTYKERTLVCERDNCGKESRPHHSLCWHHWMVLDGRESRYAWLSLHSFLPEIIGDYEAMEVHPYADDSKSGCFYVSYIEDCREDEDGQCDYEKYYDVEEALEHMPDLVLASCSGLMDDMIHVWSDGDLVACVYFGWSEEDSDEPGEVQP